MAKSPRTIIIRPLTTEKSMVEKDELNKVTFQVAPGANKVEIRHAVEQVFGVKVASVRTANREGKWKRMGRFLGQRKAWKKAWVRLAPDQKIEFFEGV